MEKDTFKTILKPCEGILYKDKKSKFFGYIFPLQKESEVRPIIEVLKKKHHTANHACYAWQLGTEKITYRANDDGEPNNSAGMPIYGQIQAYNITNILVVVVRIFGGTKLGVGGLIQAYKTTAQLTIESSSIVEKLIEDSYKVEFRYPEMDKIMRIIKQFAIKIVSQKLESSCELILTIRKSKSDTVYKQIKKIHQVSIQKLD